MKPLETEHSVTVTVGSDGAGSLDAISSIYKNKLRRNQVSISASIKSSKVINFFSDFLESRPHCTE